MRLFRKYGLKKGDLALIAFVLVLAGVIFAPFAYAPSHALTCEIVQDGKTITRVRLGAGYRDTITLHAGDITNTIRIEADSVCFAESSCPDQVCVRTGRLTRAGQTAVCLPTRVIVRLIGTQSEIDAIAA